MMMARMKAAWYHRLDIVGFLGTMGFAVLIVMRCYARQ